MPVAPPNNSNMGYPNFMVPNYQYSGTYPPYPFGSYYPQPPNTSNPGFNQSSNAVPPSQVSQNVLFSKKKILSIF